MRRFAGVAFGLFASLGIVVACTGDEEQQPATIVVPPGANPGAPPGATPPSNGDAGGLVCPTGLADCSNKNVCDTSLETDANHCGQCGHSCGAGAACIAHECKAVSLAKNLTDATAIAVNASVLVVLAAGGPAKCQKDVGCQGSPPKQLSGQDEFPKQNPHVLHVDETTVYWTGRTEGGSGSQYGLRTCEVAGCSLSPLTADEAQLGAELRGDGDVLLRYDPTSFVTKIPKGGAPKESLDAFTVEPALHFALLDGKAAFSNVSSATDPNRGVWYGDFTNTKPTKIMDEGEFVAMTKTVVYASRRVGNGTYYSIYYCPVGGCGTVGYVVGGTGVDKQTGPILDIAADTSGVYWIEWDGITGRVMSCTPGECKEGAKILAGAQAHPIALTVDDSFVYWLNAGTQPGQGEVFRIAKPLPSK